MHEELDLDTLVKSGVVLDYMFLHNQWYQSSILKNFSYSRIISLHWSLLIGGRGWDKNTNLLNDVADYYGEKYAFYLGWLMHYTSWLVLPAVGGIVLVAIQLYNYRQGKCGTNNFIDCFTTVGNSVYSILIALWTTLMCESWKRKENLLANKWLVRDYN